MKRESLEHTSLNAMSPSNPSPQSLGNPVEEEAGVWDTGDEGLQNRPSKPTKQGSYDFTETEVAGTGTTWVYTRSRGLWLRTLCQDNSTKIFGDQ